MRSLVAIVLVLSLVSLVARAEPTPDAAPIRYEVPIGRTAHSPLVVPELGYVFGAHPYQSVIVGRMESAGLDADDGVIGVVLRDFVLDGGEDMPYDLRKDRADVTKFPDGPPGINIKSWGFRCNGVTVRNVAGPAIVISNGGGHPARWRENGASGCGQISDLFLAQCYDGLVVKASDTLVRGVVVAGVRGTGIHAGCASTIKGCHVYGCREGIVLPERCYLSANVAENCRIGIVNEGGGSQIDCQQIFSCTKTGIDLRDWAILRNVSIDVPTGAVGLRIQPGASTTTAEVVVRISSGATGVIVSADSTNLVIRKSWGGARTVVIDQPVSNCRLDVCADGSEVGVEIQKLGHGNRIDITSNRCGAPVVLPAGGVSKSNVITVNGKPYRGK
jgi:hypothetical protein